MSIGKVGVELANDNVCNDANAVNGFGMIRNNRHHFCIADRWVVKWQVINIDQVDQIKR